MGGKESKQFPITTDEALKRGSNIAYLQKKLKFMKCHRTRPIYNDFYQLYL